MTKPPVFPLAMKIVLGSVEFNPFLARKENCHRFDVGGAALRQSRARISISAAGWRSVQRHAATTIALAGCRAGSDTKADESENNGRKD